MTVRRPRWLLVAHVVLLGLILVTGVMVLGGRARASIGEISCEDGDQASGAKYRICMPTPGTWNGDLLVFAHGYVAYDEPVAIPEDQLMVGDYSIPELVTDLGFAFATSSYSTNGLAVLPGSVDLIDLVGIFSGTHGAPGHVFLVGASEGGIITALSVEGLTDVFAGGLAACGPVGDFRQQIDYLGDFRVVFDYFFPGVIPGDPVSIPQWLIDEWDQYYTSTIRPVILDPANEALVDQLLQVTNAAYDPGDPATREVTISGLLWYNIFATNDGVDKLGGQPYDNQDRVYAGSLDDEALNAGVQRISADPAALAELDANYRTRGEPTVPLVTLHNEGDPIVPYWHEQIYRVMVIANDRTHLHRNIPVSRYGHCNFDASEVLGAFLLLVDLVLNPPEPVISPRHFLPFLAR